MEVSATPKGSKGESFLVSPSFLVPGIPWPVAASPQSLRLSSRGLLLCVSLHINLPLLSLIRTPDIGVRAHPKSSSTVLNLITSAKILIPNTVTFQVTGHVFWGPLFNPLRVVSLDPRVLTVTGQEGGLLRPFLRTRVKAGTGQTSEAWNCWDLNLYVCTVPAQSISLAAH